MVCACSLTSLANSSLTCLRLLIPAFLLAKISHERKSTYWYTRLATLNEFPRIVNKLFLKYSKIKREKKKKKPPPKKDTLLFQNFMSVHLLCLIEAFLDLVHGIMVCCKVYYLVLVLILIFLGHISTCTQNK